MELLAKFREHLSQQNKQSLGKFVSITVQLGLLVLVIRNYELESQGFYQNIMSLTFAGFIVHYFLPLQYRLRFFLLLSLAAIFSAFGALDGAWLIGLGLGLFGICHLPTPFIARVALLIVAGGFLAAVRTGWIDAPWSGGVLPILASMFMFRLFIYLYDLKHQKETVSVAHGLSYFFLFPNTVFPLFPVVDYSTFRRTYYDGDPHPIYQTGVKWMFRGVIHLLLYRCVNYYLVISPEEVVNASSLIQYILSNFLLILRLSGMFHLSVGILHLFGFNLPETMHFYYLASSFTDFWRRANIYWKDFMLKVFYYPVYFWLHKFLAKSSYSVLPRWRTTLSLLFSTLFVFLVTWLLHAYQWFWIQGTLLLSVPDVLFWGILGFLVVTSVLYEAKYGRKRSLGKQVWTLGNIASLVLRTVGTFTVICVLWSLWISASLAEWFSLWSVTGVGLGEVVRVIPIFLVVFVVLVIGVMMFVTMFRRAMGEKGTKGMSPKPLVFFRSAAVTGACLLLLYLIGQPGVSSQLGGKVSGVVSNLRHNRLNERDAALMVRGYYEKLINPNRFNSQLWEVEMKKPENWQPLKDTEVVRLTGDFLVKELVPSATMLFKGAKLSTNRWGMRDQDYERKKPSNTYRIALLGASIEMGHGVADEETFEWLLEERLNRENDKKHYTQYEILNLGVNAYRPPQQVMVLENKALSFQPDAVFYVAHGNTSSRGAIRHLARVARKGVDIPYIYLKEIASRAEIDQGTTKVEAQRRLQPFGDEIVSWVYGRIVTDCQQRGILPLWLLLPPAGENVGRIANEISLAEEAGFIILNAFDAYKDHDIESLWVAEWDRHPNAKGHRLIADRLHEAIRENEELMAHMGLCGQKGK